MIVSRTVRALIALATVSTAVADEPDVADRIAPFLGPRTFAVGHVDVSQVDVDGLLDLAESLGAVVHEEGRGQAKSLRAGFLAAGAKDVFVLLGWDDVPTYGGPDFPAVLVIPAEKAGAVGALANLFPRDGVVVEYFRGAVVIGPAKAVGRVRALESQPRPQLLAALRATGGVAARVVVASPADERRALRALLPEFPPPAGTRVREMFTQADWFALASDVPPKDNVTLVSSMPNEESARRMLALQTDLLRAIGRLEANDETPNWPKVVGTIDASRDGSRVVLSVAGDLVKTLAAALRPPIQSVRAEFNRNARVRALKQIGLAFHNYADAYPMEKNVTAFPARASVDEDGKPLLSWRVHALPFLDQAALYQKFRLDESWDSPHNKALLDEMPKIFDSPGAEPGMTTFLVPVAEGTLFESFARAAFKDITDGTSNTILAVDGPAKLAVPWTKPADWEVDWEKPKAGFEDGPIFALFADGSVRSLSGDIGDDALKSYLTKAGGERTPSD